MLFNSPCKTGQLQVDETAIQVMTVFKKLVWSVPRNTVTKITQQQGMIFVDLNIHTTQGVYPAHRVSKPDAEKFFALFPDLNVEATGKEWYNDPIKLTHVATYTNEKQMQKDIEAAYQHGWIIQGQSTTDSHINVGRSVTKFVLTGGLGMMTGVSRSKDKTTITFVRSSE